MAKEAGKVETRGRPRVSENTRLTGKQIKFVELVEPFCLRDWYLYMHA